MSTRCSTARRRATGVPRVRLRRIGGRTSRRRELCGREGAATARMPSVRRSFDARTRPYACARCKASRCSARHAAASSASFTRNATSSAIASFASVRSSTSRSRISCTSMSCEREDDAGSTVSCDSHAGGGCACTFCSPRRPARSTRSTRIVVSIGARVGCPTLTVYARPTGESAPRSTDVIHPTPDLIPSPSAQTHFCAALLKRYASRSPAPLRTRR